MLIVYTVGISVGSAYVFELWISSALVTLLNVFSLWCVNYGAVEMEHPFCSGNHGLPLHREVRNMNECLLVLMLDQTQTVPSMSNASKLVSELIETSPITDHLPSHEKTGVEKETFFSTGVKRSRSRNIASLYNLQLTVEGDCNGEADEAAILGTHRQAPKWVSMSEFIGRCLFLCLFRRRIRRIVNVDLYRSRRRHQSKIWWNASKKTVVII